MHPGQARLQPMGNQGGEAVLLCFLVLELMLKRVGMLEVQTVVLMLQLQVGMRMLLQVRIAVVLKLLVFLWLRVVQVRVLMEAWMPRV